MNMDDMFVIFCRAKAESKKTHTANSELKVD